MDKLIVAGASTLSILKLIDSINQENPRFDLIGFIDDSEEVQGKDFCGVPVLGKIDKETVSRFPDTLYVDNIFGGHIETRVAVSRRLDDLGVQYANLIHPGVDTSYVKFGTDCIVHQGVNISSQVEIGDHCIVSQGTRIGHDCRVGSYCFLGPASVLDGGVHVGQGATIGSGAIVVDYVKVGEMSMVGAGSVVVRDVPESTTVFGNPARVIMKGTQHRRLL